MTFGMNVLQNIWINYI